MLRLRHFLYVLALVMLAFCRARAADIYDCYNGSSEQGGNRITVNGIQSNQYVQQSYPGAVVTVYVHNTLTLASIFQDAAGTLPLANPFSSSAHSVAFVCAADGRYDFKYSGSTITTPFTVSDIKYCFACQGSGGGGVNPGTPKQVTRYNSAGTNVEDSSGSDDPLNGPTRWTDGLSVVSNGLAKQAVNSPNGTTVNLLACADASVTLTFQVTTCAAGTTKAYGVVDNGAGTSGNVQIYDHAYHACVFDNQTAVNDYAIPSPTNAGQCSDAGGAKPNSVEVLGKIVSINSGAGTLATVDWFTGDTIAPGSGGGSGTVSTCAQANSNALFALAGTVITCDISVTDDSAGNMTMFSLGLVDPNHAGFYYQKQGPAPPTTPANAVAEYPPTSVTAYAEKRPGAVGTVGQTRVINSIGTDAGGNPIAVEGWGTAGGGSGLPELQVNGVDLLNCTAGACPLQNLGNQTTTPPLGMTVGATNTSGGVVEYRVAAAQLSTPTTPTITPTGTPGATSYSYKIVGCQDTACAFHTPATAAGSTGTGNASLSSSNYNLISGYQMRARCFNIYRTVGGATQGLIAACVPFKFKDTGVAGDGATAPSTNTTQVFANPQPLPGCNVEFGSVVGVDSPPCTPQAVDDEMQSTFGAPGDVNNMWRWLTQGTATASYTSGMIHMINSTTTTQETCLAQAVGTAPYKYDGALYVNSKGASNGGGSTKGGIGFFETSSGKYELMNLLMAVPANPGRPVFETWSSATSGGANQIFGASGFGAFIYFRVENDSTNLNYYLSADKVGWTLVASHAKTFTFTTAPSDFVVCTNAESADTGNSTDFDFARLVP